MTRRLNGAPAAAAGIALSRLTGLVRAALITNFLGIGAVGDAFAAALRIPNVLQNLLGEGALSAAFIPEYTTALERDRQDAGRLAGAIAAFLISLTALLVGIGVLAARPLTRLIAWGFTGETFELTVTLVRIVMIGSGLLVLSSWCLGILNSHRRFFLSYIAPVVWNAVQIAVVVVVVALSWTGADIATAVAWAIVAGAGGQILIQLPSIRNANRSIALCSPIRRPDARRVMRRFGPAIVGRGALQVSAFADLALASLLSVGATAALAASQLLYVLPLSIIGMSVVAAELPEMSTLDEAGRSQRTSERLTQTGYLMSAVTVIYLVAGQPIVDAVFNLGGWRDRIADDDLTLIALILGAYALGLPALVASRLLQNICYGAGDTSTPSRIALVRVTVSFLVGLGLMFTMDRLLVIDGSITGFGDLEFVFGPLDATVRLNESLPARLGAVGLALGAAVGAYTEFVLLRVAVLRRANRTRLIEVALWREVLPPVFALVTGVLGAMLVDVGQPVVEGALIAAVALATHLGVGFIVRSRGAHQLASAARPIASPPSDEGAP